MHQPIDRCRICGNPQLRPVIHLGEQALTGVFPRRSDDPISTGPLELVRCATLAGSGHPGGAPCGLVQLRHSFDLGEMYGENYGYRSSLNRSMVRHLQQKVEKLRRLFPPRDGSLVIDIGSNDGTLLSFHPAGGAALVGIDPTARKFRQFYRPDIQVIEDFFSADAVRHRFGDRQADLITSIAMFYDLEDPQAFVRQIASVLSPHGVWHFEQSYLPMMLSQTAYDTICHEHLEYYGLRQINWLLERAGLKAIDVELNDINGGSFAVTATHADSPHAPAPAVARVLADEQARQLDEAAPYEAFARRVVVHRDQLIATLADLRRGGATVVGYGASTKGNVILQYCGLTPRDLPVIAEVNADKFGCFTPGSHIPIVSEADAKARRPDYLLVLPWHFRENLLQREQAYLQAGGKMIFPLPRIEIVPS